MTSAAPTLADLAREAQAEAQRLDREIEEIDLLVQQARMEATRHEERRANANARVGAAESRGPAGAADLHEAIGALVSSTRRASLMEAQIDVLEGKRRALIRFRDRMRSVADALGAAATTEIAEDEGSAPPTASRAILTAQEDLRRDIARQMHDGPAQSLANIALQAQIVQRLVARDPERAASEVAQLVTMVEGTLDATKSFIFDVRPMVLDDLGLVPTIRRVARERSRRHQMPIDFDSLGPDRRLAEDVESGLFRIIDEAITGFLETRPARISIRFDWSDDQVRARVTGVRPEEERAPAPAKVEEPAPASARSRFGLRRGSDQQPDVLPALADMIEEQRADRAASDVATRDAIARSRALPATTWRQIQQRARTIGTDVALTDAGQTLEATATAS